MTQNNKERLRKLEEVVEKLRLARIRAEEKLSLLREERDKLIKELEERGVTPRNAKATLTKMADDIDKQIKAIEEQIPPDLEELLNDGNSKN